MEVMQLRKANTSPRWAEALPTAGSYFVLTPTGSSPAHLYQQLWHSFHRLDDVGFVDPSDQSVIPFLSVADNILIDSPKNDIVRLRQFLFDNEYTELNTHDFLDKPASQLNETERFYVQLFRFLLLKRHYIITTNFLDNQGIATFRIFFNLLENVLQATDSHLIMVTSDHEMVDGQPAERLLSADLFTQQ
ncbi:hypothetical protein [Schleiferilactobacillus harbinensis]|jgi:ABC-type lipoprotein export system ATPase subunit|uniref:Uncharacterized protein n=2 Tax=Schleiferilactobacillus harbinensis TaxID=304207 RepID=A0A0R1X6C8_9LACO|nr:hypothetical protein [Schleiferilactobacillus harbinensis]KRM25537.1 hypothetical protein FC91_GL000709 [Schleiferilactobacillus harbinensis DSM 16991]